MSILLKFILEIYTVLLYRKELDTWLKLFQESLNLDNKRIVDPLKGLPQKKAKRRDQWFTSLSDPDAVVADKEDETPYIEKRTVTSTMFRSDSTGQQIPEPPPLDGPKADPTVKMLSYKKFDV